MTKNKIEIQEKLTGVQKKSSKLIEQVEIKNSTSRLKEKTSSIGEHTTIFSELLVGTSYDVYLNSNKQLKNFKGFTDLGEDLITNFNREHENKNFTGSIQQKIRRNFGTKGSNPPSNKNCSMIDMRNKANFLTDCFILMQEMKENANLLETFYKIKETNATTKSYRIYLNYSLEELQALSKEIKELNSLIKNYENRGEENMQKLDLLGEEMKVEKTFKCYPYHLETVAEDTEEQLDEFFEFTPEDIEKIFIDTIGSNVAFIESHYVLHFEDCSSDSDYPVDLVVIKGIANKIHLFVAKYEAEEDKFLFEHLTSSQVDSALTVMQNWLGTLELTGFESETYDQLLEVINN